MRYILVLTAMVQLTFGQNNTIMDCLKASSTIHTLIDLINQAGLADALSQPGPFTIFAPDDRAFLDLPPAVLASLKNDTNKLASILKYHVISGEFQSADLMANELQLETLSGQNIRVNYYASLNRILVEGGVITYKDKVCSNGVIHRINHVLMPPTGDLVSLVSNDPDLSTLLAAVQAAGLADALKEGPLTLFAPTNAAFAALGNDTVNKLIAHPDVLADVLKYHLVHGTLYASGMHSGLLNTLEEKDRERIRTLFAGLIYVDSGRVVEADDSATNGVMHKINHVLIPHSLASTIQNL